MTTVLNRETIQVKRDIQRRIENYVIKYCEALEENFKQHSINSYKRNIGPMGPNFSKSLLFRFYLKGLRPVRRPPPGAPKKTKTNFDENWVFCWFWGPGGPQGPHRSTGDEQISPGSYFENFWTTEGPVQTHFENFMFLKNRYFR